MAAPGCEEARAGGSALGAGPSPSGPSPSGVARRRGRTLLVRHLPAELTAAEKEELLRHFGAAAVRVLADHGRLVRARGPGGSGGEPRGPGVEARPAALRWVLPCEGGGGDTALSPQLSCGVFLCRAAAVWVRVSGRAGCLLGAWHAAQVSGLCGSRPCHASSYRISKIPCDEDFPNICYHKC